MMIASLQPLLSLILLLSLSHPIQAQSTAAGLETLIGIQGRDFVLLGADTAVGPNIIWTATAVDKIAVVLPRIAVAAAGDAADADRLVGLLQAQAKLLAYEQHDMGGDVLYVRVGQEALPASRQKDSATTTVSQMAQMARAQIAQQLRSRSPYRVCLLVAGMQPRGTASSSLDAALSTQHLQEQVHQARSRVHQELGENSSLSGQHRNNSWKASNTPPPPESSSSASASASTNTLLRPCLFWLDEYGTLLEVPYGAHGVGSMFLNAILDEGYTNDLTRVQARALMQKCFDQLRQRYAIQAPKPPCIKCIDQDGVHLLE